MISIKDSAIVEKIKGTGRTFKASIKVGNTTFTEIKSLKQTTPFASNQKISIGETPSSFIEAEIHDCRLSLKGYEIEVNLHIDDYLIPLGLFTVQEPTEANGSGIQKIIAYDRMSNTSNFTYEAKGHTNAGDIFAEICSQCDYSAEIGDLTAISISDDVLNGYDCRTALGYLAGFLGKNCVVGSDGTFKMVKYHIVDNEIDINSLDTLDFPSSGSSVDYIFCTVDENKTVDSGTGKSGINIVNPLISTTEQLQTILDDIRTGIGTNYYPATFKQLNGDPRIEVGDTVLVQHRNILTGDVETDYVPVMSLVKEFDGGLTVTIEAYEPETEFHISTPDQIKLLQAANKNTSKRTEALAELNEVVSNALGLYQTETKGSGGDVKTYYHNAPTLSNSTYIFTMNAEGFAFTTGENCWNDGDPIWANGITKDGNAIFNYLFAEKISANLIEAGKLTSINGKTYFDLDKGEILTEADKYIYRQNADGVYVKSDAAVSANEFYNSIINNETEMDEIRELFKDETNPIIKAFKILLEIENRYIKRCKGLFCHYVDEENMVSYMLKLAGNKAVFSTFGDNVIETEYSAKGIKSTFPFRIDAPETDVAMTYYANTDNTFEDMLAEIWNTMTNTSYKQIQFYDKIGLYDNKFIGTLWRYTANYGVLEAVSYSGLSARKCFYAGEWQPWEWINPPMIAGVEYQTVERYNNKPVYVKLVDCGNLPNKDMKEVATGINGKYAFDMRFEIHQSGGQLVNEIYVSSGFNPITRMLLLAGGNLQIYTNADVSTYTAKVTIKYTKS